MDGKEELQSPVIHRRSGATAIKIQALDRALRGVEWGGMFGWGLCPACGANRGSGHADFCPIETALSPEVDAGPAIEALEVATGLVTAQRLSLMSTVGMVEQELDDLDTVLARALELLRRV